MRLDKSDDPLANLPGYALRRAANAMMTELSDRLAPLDLRVIEATVMLLIDGRDDITSSEIGRALDIQRANMVPLLNRLEAAGLIGRHALNRKSQAIMLTVKGAGLLAEVQMITTAFESDLLARIPEMHRDHLLPALNALWTQVLPTPVRR